MTTRKATQGTFDQIGNDMKAVTEQLHEGMITVQEFVHYMSQVHEQMKGLDFAGLVCPFTGLRYPTEEEMKAAL